MSWQPFTYSSPKDENIRYDLNVEIQPSPTYPLGANGIERNCSLFINRFGTRTFKDEGGRLTAFSRIVSFMKIN